MRLHADYGILLDVSRTKSAKNQQEGQHPLTGQRTANFRLLAKPNAG